MKLVLNTVLVFGLTPFLSASSFAQSKNRSEKKKPPTFAELLEKMDTNEDGKLSKEEVKGRLKENFDKVDAYEDGFITKEELNKVPKPERREKE